MQRLLDKLYESKESRANDNNLNLDTTTQMDNNSATANNNNNNNDLDTHRTKTTSDLEDEDDDEVRALIRQARHKLKLRYLSGEAATEDEEDEVDSTVSGLSDSVESLESSLLCDVEELSTLVSEKRSRKSRRIRSSEDLLRSGGRGLVAGSLRREREVLALAEELLEKFAVALEKRRRAFESKSEARLVGREAEERRVDLEREGLEMEEMELGLKAGKRLVRQKKNQLSLIATSVAERSGSVEELRETGGTGRAVTVADLGDDRNLSELLGRVRGLVEGSGTGGKRVGAVLRAMPKVSAKLRATLRSLARLSGQGEMLEGGGSGGGGSCVDEKWQSYLGFVGQGSRSQAKMANTNR